MPWRRAGRAERKFGYVYVLLNVNGIRKIGQSVRPDDRSKELSLRGPRCWVEFKVLCLEYHMRTAERHAHALLWNHWVTGEWFAVDAGTAARAVMAGVTAARYGETVWQFWRQGGKPRAVVRCPDNWWRVTDT